MEEIFFTSTVLFVALTGSFISANAQPRLLPHFAAMYGHLSTVTIDEQDNDRLLYRWKNDSASYMATFKEDGSWVNTIVHYPGSVLPESVKRQVATAYPDYQIGWVDELLFPHKDPVYRVQLNVPASLLYVQVNQQSLIEEKASLINP